MIWIRGAICAGLLAGLAAGTPAALAQQKGDRKAAKPMPRFNLRAMSDSDLKAIYAYLRHLGPGGVTAPVYHSPDKIPSLPFVQFPSPPPSAAAPKSK